MGTEHYKLQCHETISHDKSNDTMSMLPIHIELLKSMVKDKSLDCMHYRNHTITIGDSINFEQKDKNSKHTSIYGGRVMRFTAADI